MSFCNEEIALNAKAKAQLQNNLAQSTQDAQSCSFLDHSA
jgi:hypothetical protein